MNWIGTTVADKYLIQAFAGEGGMSRVFCAQDLTLESRRVALKILKRENVSRRPEDVIRFRNEAVLVSRLNHPNIIRIFDIGEFRQCLYLATEWIDGVDLAAWLDSRAADLNLEQALAIMTQICEGLKAVHHANILHRDLNPGNIMVLAGPPGTPDAAVVKLIDFGLAQLLEFQENQGENAVCGTFGYMSPEQTGFLRKTADPRSDLYSVGVIFYQLVTRRLPFCGKDFSSLVHQHIAKVPDPPSSYNRNLPKIIDRMILKLLEKEPEQRYQSAEGFLADLQKCRQRRRDFILGEDDITIKLDYRSKLIRRELPLASLKTAYENALGRNQGGLCLIHGEAGKGKTRLAEEFRDYVYAQGGTFIGGKCFCGENKIPFEVFKDALNQYLYLYGTYPHERQAQVREKIRQAIGELGEIMLSLNPLLQPILGECPPLVALEPDREHQRFLLVASRFFCHLSRCEKPLVFFLDDLQWADEGSFSLLHEIARDLMRFPLVIVGACRDDELAPGHGLRRLRDQCPAATDIALEAFDQSGMNLFLSALLHDTLDHTRDIAAFVLAKSKGNPFFALQIVKQLVMERALYQRDKRWHINHPILDRLEISATIVDILMKRISLLQPRETAVLSCAAVIGRSFDMQVLFAIAGLPQAEVVASVDQAVEFQLLEPDGREKGKILFVHDRIREAFCQTLSQNRQRDLHEKIGAALEAENRGNLENAVFELVHHYAAAENRAKTLLYALPAARKARTHYANEEAVNYFKLAVGLLEESGQGGGDTWLQARESIGELYLRLGKNDEAVELFQCILQRVETPLAKAGIYKQISQAYFKKGNWQACEAFGRQGLRLFGDRLPATRLGVAAGLAWEFGTHLAHNLFPGWLLRKRENPQGEKYKLSMWFYYPLCWAYAFSDTLKCLRANLKILNLTEAKIGPSRELFLSIGAYGGICMVAGWFQRAIHYHERALAMKSDCKDEWSRALSLQFLGFCYEFMGDYALAQDYIDRCITSFRKIGDLRELGICINARQVCHYFSANYQSQWLALEQYLDIVGKMNDDYGLSDSWHYLARSHAETGDLDEALDYARKSFDLSARKELWFVHCMACTALGVIYFERGELAASRSHLEKARELYLHHHFLKHYASDVFVHLADTYQALCRQAGAPNPETRLLDAKLKRTCREALRQTKTWATQHAGALRVNANYYASRGKVEQAKRCFGAAAALAERIGRKFEWARILFEFGVCLQHGGDEAAAKRKFGSAYRIFKEIGAKVYAAKVADVLGAAAGEQSGLERPATEFTLFS